ncbi:Maf-like protein YceF [BD1-7 clade bacterium]|uniref:7-methyl-GTP pyrophosphatase n=1 Tax=BD1-7 clade bacterium TaxID=2029982 RepID=A0A5S9PXS7_9GAMM|nr:Maf-like protein YceF [BD1-7 clade bacterium]CAA0109193.1 Maf-like protein YceF [BD1-7 clade bacterium]
MPDTAHPRIILASGSRYRRKLLQQLEIPFDCISPEIDETASSLEQPDALALRLSKQKAQAAANQLTSPEEPAIIIGSDQVAACDGKVFGKPGTEEEALKQLTWCQGKTVTFYTGLSLLHSGSSKQITRLCPFSVTFRTRNETQLKAYIQREQPLDCAGSFKAEGLGITLFKSMAGKDPNSLIGLPLIDLVEMLEEFGIDLL